MQRPRSPSAGSIRKYVCSRRFRRAEARDKPRWHERFELESRFCMGDEGRQCRLRRRTPREYHTSTRAKRVEPTPRWRDNASIHIDDIGFWYWYRNCIAEHDCNIFKAREVATCQGGEFLVDLIGRYHPLRQHQHRENCRVVAGPSTDMRDRLAGFGSDSPDPACMQERLAVVDSLFGIERDQVVLINVARVSA